MERDLWLVFVAFWVKWIWADGLKGLAWVAKRGLFGIWTLGWRTCFSGREGKYETLGSEGAFWIYS